MRAGRPGAFSLRKVPAPLRHRDFALLWSGQSVSMAGDGIFIVALALETLRVDNSPTALSLVLAARIVPTVCLLLLGGVVVDRIPRRLAMLTSDAVRGLAVATIAAGSAAGGVHLWALLVMSVIFGVGDAFFAPASVAIVPELLPADLLVQGSALTTTSQQVARMLAGPALGGVIVASQGLAWAFALDAASFAVSAACLLLMTSRPRQAPSGRSIIADAREGLRYCRSQRWLWATMVAAGIANFAAFSPLSVLVPLLVRGVLHGGPLVLGLVVAAAGVGGAVASLVAGHAGAPRRRVTAMWLGWGAAGVCVAGLGLAPWAWVAGLLVAVVWGLLMYGNVLWHPLMQERVPAHLLGRAASVDWLVSFVGSPLGIVAAGIVAGTIGTRATFVAGGGLAALMTLVLLLPGVRDPEQRGDAPVSSPAAADGVPGEREKAADGVPGEREEKAISDARHE
ncbi:MAG TPA: MFS transporter [Streptosporangiaceae bacterium]|nr:MFS transporter [Streptosporangiaceae bacterium]